MTCNTPTPGHPSAAGIGRNVACTLGDFHLGSSELWLFSAKECWFFDLCHVCSYCWVFSLQACMTSLYILVGDISSLIQGFSAAQWVFIFLTFISILIMRFTHKDDKRPFKVCWICYVCASVASFILCVCIIIISQVWWIVPAVMIVVSVFLIVLPLTTAPRLSLAAFAIILSGAPVYFIFVMEKPRRLRPAFLDSCSGQ